MSSLKEFIGMDINFDKEKMEFVFNDKTVGHGTEKRNLDDIRASLLDPKAEGPKIPYAVAMDVYNEQDSSEILKRNLLYGIMFFNSGKIGDEPVRSQGHIHSLSKSTNYSTCEVYQIISGTACIYMQEFVDDNPGRCFAVIAKKGDVVIVPPGWAHATINYDYNVPMIFGAWCIRDFGFEYKEIRSRKGLAFYPVVNAGKIEFIKNKNYDSVDLEVVKARSYDSLGISSNISIYKQFEKKHDLFEFIYKPLEYNNAFWEKILPS